MSTNIVDVTDATFEQEVTNSKLPVLVDFWAPWCGPCLALTPILETLAATYDQEIKFVKVNSDENPELVKRFNVRGIPQVFFISGQDPARPVKERTRTRLALELDALLG